MGIGSALWKGDSWDVGWGVLTLDHDGTMALQTAEGIAPTTLSLPNSAFVDAYADDSWVYALGASDGQVVVASRAGPQSRIVVTVERLRTGAVTTSGTHAVRFHPRPNHRDCILTWEMGIARISPEVGCEWTFHHNDPDQRLRKLTADTAELVGLSQAFSIDIGDGCVSSQDTRRGIEVDHDTFSEWRRGIGR